MKENKDMAHSRMLFRKILVPVDFSPCSERAYRVGLSLAKAFSAEVLLLHVIDVKTLEALNRLGLSVLSREASQRKQLNRRARMQLRRLIEWEQGQGAPIRRVVVEGVPFVEIGRAVRTEQIDLVVLGSWGGERATLNGSSSAARRKKWCGQRDARCSLFRCLRDDRVFPANLAQRRTDENYLGETNPVGNRFFRICDQRSGPRRLPGSGL